MDTQTGNNIYEVGLHRLVTTTEALAVFVRADNEQEAVELAYAKAEFGGGQVTHIRTDTTVEVENGYVQFVSKVSHNEIHHA